MAKIAHDIFEIAPGNYRDYDKLGRYHYRQGSIKPYTHVFVLRGRKPYDNSFPNPVGVIVYRMPLPSLKARTSATEGFFQKPLTQSDRLRLVNKHIRYLARVIIDPRFRKLGLATFLIKNTVELVDSALTETITPIDFTNKMFQNCGFQLHFTAPALWYYKMRKTLDALGLTEQSFELPNIIHKRIDALKPVKFLIIDKAMTQFVNHFRHHMNMPHSADRTAFVLDKLYCPNAYLLWKHPSKRLPGQKTGKQHYSTQQQNQQPATSIKI